MFLDFTKSKRLRAICSKLDVYCMVVFFARHSVFLQLVVNRTPFGHLGGVLPLSQSHFRHLGKILFRMEVALRRWERTKNVGPSPI